MSRLNSVGLCHRCGQHGERGWALLCLPCWDACLAMDDDEFYAERDRWPLALDKALDW